MKKAGLVLFLAVVGLLGVIIFSANQKAQAQTPDSYKIENWCFAGGEWGDGRCNTPSTQAERDWLWKTGFYLGQYYLGKLTCQQIPDYVQIIVGCRFPPSDNTAVQEIFTPQGVVTVQAVVDPCSGGVTWVVVFTGSPSGATANQSWATDNFTVATDSTCPANAHEIHGNNNPNVIVAGSGNDLIFGYAGNDTLSGGAGNDTLNGGNESCSGALCNQFGTVGDSLTGGEGNDVLNGGDESCSGNFCNDIGTLGDSLTGGEGNDVLNGGDESCSGNFCNDIGTLGDSLTGDAGADTLNGGNESCSGTNCSISQLRQGDILNAGGAGNADGSPDVLDGNGGTDTCNSTAGEGDTQANCP